MTSILKEVGYYLAWVDILFLLAGLVRPALITKIIRQNISRWGVFFLFIPIYMIAAGLKSIDHNGGILFLIFSCICLLAYFVIRKYMPVKVGGPKGKGIFEKLSDMYQKHNEESARLRAIEEVKIQKIVSGEIEPITIEMRLEEGEKAYAQYRTERRAIVETVKQYTEGKTKKKGGLTRALVGGVLLGPAGAIIGSTTAGSTYTEVTKEKRERAVKVIDAGTLVFTNKRVIFHGNNNVKTLRYPEIISTNFSYNGEVVIFRYEGMMDGEEYRLVDKDHKYSKNYYDGITQKLLST